MIRIAIYDMDKTITRQATFNRFLRHSLMRQGRWRAVFLPVILPVGAAYGLRLINRGRLKSISLRLLAGRGNYALRSASFAQETIAHNILPHARAQIAADQVAGARLVLATASYRFYAAEIGHMLGFTDIIATDNNGAKIKGKNCYGPAKLAMIKAWMNTQGIKREEAHISFYSDHVSDTPCFEWADAAYTVNPNPSLRRLAHIRGWPVFDWT
jgi:HAD superfamily phosphoserine phosphatase-like hydrolase